MTTKIPSPKELKKLQDAKIQPFLDTAIERISNQLINEKPYRNTYNISLTPEELAIREYIEKAFIRAGWDAKVKSEQRDGVWIILKEPENITKPDIGDCLKLLDSILENNEFDSFEEILGIAEELEGYAGAFRTESISKLKEDLELESDRCLLWWGDEFGETYLRGEDLDISEEELSKLITACENAEIEFSIGRKLT